MQFVATSSPLKANLAHLNPRTRRALESESDALAVVVDASGSVARASVLTTAGQRVAVHEADDPVDACRQMVARMSERDAPHVLVVIGLGLGYLLDALEQTTLRTRVLALEPFPGVARAMLTRRDWTRWLASGRLTLLVGPDYAGAAEAWKLLGRDDEPPRIIMAPVIGREFADAARRAKDVVRQILAGARANDHARHKFAGRYLLNTLANLPVIAAEGDANALTGIFADVPAVVVAAGPSLDQSLELLSNVGDRALIIAVDTALRPLIAAGIRPHLVVTVDPSEINARHLQDLDDTSGVWLVSEGSIDPHVLPAFARRTFTFRVSNHEPWPWLRTLGVERGVLRTWGSVVTSAFDLALRMKCDPIVFTGADLAYTDGRPYCRGTVFEGLWTEWHRRGSNWDDIWTLLTNPAGAITMTDLRGGSVRTAPHLIAFRNWLLEQMSATDGRRFINATGGGILHGANVTQMTLNDALAGATASNDTHESLSAAHAARRTVDLRSPVRALADAFRRRAANDLLARWMSFTANGVAVDDIIATLVSCHSDSQHKFRSGALGWQDATRENTGRT